MFGQPRSDFSGVFFFFLDNFTVQLKNEVGRKLSQRLACIIEPRGKFSKAIPAPRLATSSD